MKYAVLLSGIFFSAHTFSQVQQFEQVDAHSVYQANRSYSQDQGRKYNLDAFYAHPDFGQLTFAAPYGKNVVEDISKRTADSRYYIDLNDPSFFYIEKSAMPINTYQDGYWRAIDATLHQIDSKTYRSGVQPCPTVLDINNQKSSIQLGNELLSFNNYSLQITDNYNQVSTVAANWTQINVANTGAYITNIFPGIDMRLEYKQGAIKSEFVIKQNLNVKQIAFIDNLQVPNYLNGYIHTDANTGLNSVFFNNTNTGEIEVTIDPAFSRDASANREIWTADYVLTNNQLQVICDSSVLNDPTKVYPIVVDPLVTVVGPIASPNNLMGSLPAPSYCSHTINVTYPGGTTPWDVSAYWNITTDFCSDVYIDWGLYFDCWMSDAQVWLTSSCGGISPTGAPGIIWTCIGCDSPGNWYPTLPFGGNPSTQSLAQCYSPSCANQTMSFTINSNRSECSNVYGYDNCSWATNNCNYMSNWSVTVQGRNAETLSNTATGNGSQTIAAPTCASGTQLLNPTPQYGVPGYTYVWSTGATTSTITVPNAVGTYTCQVTDACGTVRTATFTITCPLGIQLSNFDAKLNEAVVDLSWTAQCEKEMKQFNVLRAGADLQFKPIGQVAPTGAVSTSQNYRTTDSNPIQGINYYQLAIEYANGEVELSEIRSVLTKENPIKGLHVVPNPNNGSFSLQLAISQADVYVVELISTEGKVYYQQEQSLAVGKQLIPVSNVNLQKGTYIARIRSGNKNFQEKFVVE